MTEIVAIRKEIDKQVADKETFNTLVTTTFNGLNVNNVKQALMEGMMRGFQFDDFLKKNVYAVPFKGGYSLVTSVDYARKVGMRSGVVGKAAPEFEEDENGKVVTCTVTVKRKIEDYVGDYTATVYFDEYYKAGKEGKPSLWDTKPRTMIAKVAEMHALRMACPEELSQSYVEEEMQQPIKVDAKEVDATDYEKKLRDTQSLDELKRVWASMPIEAKQKLEQLKESLKDQYANA